MSLKIPKDIEILTFCSEQARNRYQIAKAFKNNYANTFSYIKRLKKMGYVFIIREENGPGPNKVKYYLTTDKGRAVLRGFKEANRE